KITRKEKRFCDYAIAPANFRFSPRARHEDEADYLCHADPEVTRSDLVEMGFDREQVYRLPAHSRNSINTDESNRLDNYLDEESSKALEKVLLCEEYARIDIDGDGIAERVKVFRVENEILIDAETGKPSIETVEDQPFAVFCPFPRPHRLVGYSLADKVLDIQLARSFVARQLFDGLALSNMPRPIVDSNQADADTYSDILNPIPGSPIRVKGGPNSVQALQSGFDVGKSMQAMEWLTGERESRTGITRLNQGLDADTLNKTATGTALMQSQGQQQEEYIARNLAETLARLFRKKYRLMKAEGEPFKVKVDGVYKEVDPSRWPDEVNMVVRVGLGSNSKDKRIQARMAMAQLMAQGTLNGDVEPQHRFKLIDGLARDMGIGQGDDFWTDPDAPPETDPETGLPKEKPEKVDPEAMKVQAEQQMQQAKLQGEQQLAQMRLQVMQAEGEAKQQLARDQAEFEAQLAREKAQRESDLAEQKMAMELRLAEQRMALEAGMANHKASMAEQQMSTNKPGGRLDA
ncbi:MAG: portal protein, partial [Beijerinckiaceae bacterium]